MPELIFGKYERLKRLAVGGMGEVFVARQVGIPGFERWVILKSLLPELALQPEFVNQFLDEARVAATLNHPHVVSLYEAGLWQGTYFIAMEFIDGLNLAQLSKLGAQAGLQIPWNVALFIVREAALGLEYAHTATDARGKPLKLVHRDISPQNIMVRFDGVTKVVDFGIARANNRVTRTATGSVKGKLMYMSPEQLGGDAVDGASDQWSLGVVAWELLTGKDLFGRGSDPEVISALLHRPIADPCTLRADLPAAVGKTVLRMLERDLERRFATLGDAATEMEAALKHVTGGRERTALFIQTLGASSSVGSLETTPDFVLTRGELQFGKSRSDREPVPSTTRLIRKRGARRQVWLLAGLALGGAAIATGGSWWLEGRPSVEDRPRGANANAGPLATAPDTNPVLLDEADAGHGSFDLVDAGQTLAPDAGPSAPDSGTTPRGRKEPVTPPPTRKFGVVGISDAIVYIDGSRQNSMTPLYVDLRVGKHKVRVEKPPGTVVIEKEVQVEANGKNQFNVSKEQ